MKKAGAELKAIVLARGSRLMDLHGVGPVVAARVLADVGDVARFRDRNRFASAAGTAPIDASSGEQDRHRLSRAGNRRMNHMIHIAAITQIRLDTEGRAYYPAFIMPGGAGRPSGRSLSHRTEYCLHRRSRPCSATARGPSKTKPTPVGTHPMGAPSPGATGGTPRRSSAIGVSNDRRNRFRAGGGRPTRHSDPRRPPAQALAGHGAGIRETRVVATRRHRRPGCDASQRCRHRQRDRPHAAGHSGASPGIGSNLMASR